MGTPPFCPGLEPPLFKMDGSAPGGNVRPQLLISIDYD